MTDLDDQDDEIQVVNLVQDSIVPLSIGLVDVEGFQGDSQDLRNFFGA